jgi:hypothetical protein
MNSTPWFQIKDTPVCFLDATGVAAHGSWFDVDGVIVEVDTGLNDDMEDSGYAQRLNSNCRGFEFLLWWH